MSTEFKGRKVMVTGASRGIGRAIALAFAERGAKVALVYRSNTRAAESALSALAGNGHLLVRADLASADGADDAVAASVDGLGGLDIVINNAGIFIPHSPTRVSYNDWQDAWRKTLDTNLVAPANVCFAAAQHLCAQGSGKIINVSSRGAFRGEPDAPAYGASKAGLNSMSQSLAVALAPQGVFVAAIAPGFIDTDMAAAALEGAAGDAVRRQSPLGRVGRPQEVARVAVLLASDGIDFATGTIVDVNGASYLRS